MWGADNGWIGQIELLPNEPRVLWKLRDTSDDMSVRVGGVTSMCSFDISRDGMNELVIGRDNGALEVFAFESHSLTPSLALSTSIQGSITGIDVGGLMNPAINEIFCSTYNGKIVLLKSTEVKEEETLFDVEDKKAKKKNSKLMSLVKDKGELANKNTRIQSLKVDIGTMEREIRECRDVAKASEGDLKSRFTDFKVSAKMILQEDGL